MRSPTDVLITKWTRYSHNVTELFKLLADMKHLEAMKVISDQVDKRYHVWMLPEMSRRNYPSSKKQINADGQSKIFKAVENKKEGKPKEVLQENLKDLSNLPVIAIEQLEIATNNWAQENVLGKGGFGIVYKGEFGMALCFQGYVGFS